MSKVKLICADVLEGLAGLPDDHFSSCVTDPPYELGFMGKKWDSSGISYSVEMWKEVYRVLKPGAHLLAFGGSRTYHRLACAIEDAGFIIRDQIMWLYGSGFPKSLDVSKGIDKVAGVKREVMGRRTDGRYAYGFSDEAKKACGVENPQQGFVGEMGIITAPATPLARQWDGWGTALKPAHEPIVVARKPLEGTVVANVLKWGCGAINVAGCRIEVDPEVDDPRLGGKGTWSSEKMAKNVYEGGYVGERVGSDPAGRWPANVIHDGSDEVVACFPDSKGQQGDVRGTEQSHTGGEGTVCYGEYGRVPAGKRGDNGSAARFFYCAKASQEERNRGCEGIQKKPVPYSEYRPNVETTKSYVSEYPDGSPRPMNKQKNNHPTVKPLALMAYLVRLVTPPGGLVLDPFMGSGSTLIAAAKEGFDGVGIDKEAAYVEMSRKRIAGELGMLVEIETEAP